MTNKPMVESSWHTPRHDEEPLPQAIRNLLELNGMECYQGYDTGVAHWRVQQRRHSYQTKYIILPLDASIVQWIYACEACRSRWP